MGFPSFPMINEDNPCNNAKAFNWLIVLISVSKNSKLAKLGKFCLSLDKYGTRSSKLTKLNWMEVAFKDLCLFHGRSKNFNAWAPKTLTKSPSSSIKKSRPCSTVRPVSTKLLGKLELDWILGERLRHQMGGLPLDWTTSLASVVLDDICERAELAWLLSANRSVKLPELDMGDKVLLGFLFRFIGMGRLLLASKSDWTPLLVRETGLLLSLPLSGSIEKGQIRLEMMD